MNGPGMIATYGGRNTPDQAPLRQRIATCKMGRVETSGTSQTSATRKATILNPSRRLSCSISLSFEPDQPVTLTGYGTGCVWTLTAYRMNPENRRVATLHTIESGQALPRLYEVDTAVRLIEVSAVMTIPQSAAGNVAGDWILACEWEPNQFISDPCGDEVANLLSLCGIKPSFNNVVVLAP